MKRKPHPILVVDDELGNPNSSRRTAFLRAVGYYPSTGGKERVEGYPYEFEFHTGQTEAGVNSIEAVKTAVLKRWPATDGTRWALVLLDVRFDEASGRSDEKFGFTLLRALRENSRFGKDLPIVMLTSEGKGKKDEADQLNADGFFPKADEAAKALWSEAGLKEKVFRYGLIPDDRDDSLLNATHTQRLLGRSLALLQLLRDARFYALEPSGSRILYGESGTGKTELAGYIHCYTKRNGPYVHWFADPANKELMKGELFGWWVDAHDHADFSQAGKIEEAQGGTFFLDEVAHLPGDIQMAFLQSRKQDADGWRTLARQGKFPRSEVKKKEAIKSVVPGARLLGDHRIQVDVLLLTGTEKNLEDPDVRQKLGFHAPLHNALGTPLRSLSLNDRREDIPELFHAFVQRVLTKPGKPIPSFQIEPGVFDLMQQRNWSTRGNVRDLERIAEYAAQHLGDFRTIRLDRLPMDVLKDAEGKPAKAPQQPVKDTAAGVTPSPAEPPQESPGNVDSAPGALTRAELEHLASRAHLLEEAAEATRKVDAATGKKTKYQPTHAVTQLMGHKVTTTNAKRIIKDILDTILNTPDFLVEAYGEKNLEEIRAWVKSKPPLVALHRYAIGEIGADEI
jgi:DNA-binding NtrC family response regulator